MTHRGPGAGVAAIGIVVALGAACSTADQGSSPAASATSPASAPPNPSSPSSSSSTHVPTRPVGQPYPCGPTQLTCRDFADAASAMRFVIETDRPRILAFGEAHARKGTESIKSTTARFTDDLLPELKEKASALILELWVADKSCSKEKVAAVQEKQKIVTEGQAETNQNEFVRLGEKSKALGIVPFILKPSCADYDEVKAAKDDAVLVMLDVITKNMREKVVALYGETQKKQPGKMVVAYGGALHNDVAPKAGREAWSYAADLDRLAEGRYVELDLVVPELIQDTDSWKSLWWFPGYDAAAMGSRVVLIATGKRSYALVFPASPGDEAKRGAAQN